MTTWMLLLLASVLLDNPDVTFSGLTPEDPATAHLCDGEQFFQGLAQDGPQCDLPTRSEELGLRCGPCLKVIQKLQDMVGEQPTQETITSAASRVCSKMKLLRGLCKTIMRTFLCRIALDIIAGKTARDVCVDLKMCKPAARLGGILIR
ncbi:PREDICTED: granulysin isoform X1 [Galeopterus variegatus]|uniref:Granulysin isoform X1 n=1 Tax=Galeopterus variegatus TaxID=482537 RepID=A0ABM0R5R0_GALVR|nr:PREDICTED: granulysin isoform X1 [Galeopterus variegatus]